MSGSSSTFGAEGESSLRFSYQPAIGACSSHHLVHSPAGDVLCELRDFELKAEDREEILAAAAALPDEPPCALHYLHDVFYLQYQIHAASRHLREFNDRYGRWRGRAD